MLKALERYYAVGGESVESLISDMEDDASLAKAAEAMEKDGPLDLTSVEALADSAPVRKLLNMVFLLAIKDHASDMHFEPFENEFKIRIRADGVLYEMVPPPRHLAFAITTRIKVMADLDIAERRMPQDGRIQLSVGGHPVDMRVSVLPTMFGESVVLRILDRSVVMLDLDVVGMDPTTLAEFRTLIRKPNGIVLVTGPTGSGKTTTLYGALNELNVIDGQADHDRGPGRIRHRRHRPDSDRRGDRQHVRPVLAEHLAAGPGQDPRRRDPRPRDGRNRRAGVADRAHGLQHAAHERRAEHGDAAARHGRAAVPAHGDARGRVGPAAGPQDLLRSAARRPCPPIEILAELNLTPDDVAGKKIYRGRGCESCNNTGFKGRTGLFELMVINDALRNVINEGGVHPKAPQRRAGQRHAAAAHRRARQALLGHHHHRRSDSRNGAGRIGNDS